MKMKKKKKKLPPPYSHSSSCGEQRDWVLAATEGGGAPEPGVPLPSSQRCFVICEETGRRCRNRAADNDASFLAKLKTTAKAALTLANLKTYRPGCCRLCRVHLSIVKRKFRHTLAKGVHTAASALASAANQTEPGRYEELREQTRDLDALRDHGLVSGLKFMAGLHNWEPEMDNLSSNFARMFSSNRQATP